MKFLVIFKENRRNIAPTDAVKLVDATPVFLEDLKKEGKVVDWGWLAGVHGGYCVFNNIETMGEVHMLCELIPIVNQLCSVEVIPIVDYQEWSETKIKLREKLKDRGMKLD